MAVQRIYTHHLTLLSVLNHPYSDKSSHLIVHWIAYSVVLLLKNYSMKFFQSSGFSATIKEKKNPRTVRRYGSGIHFFVHMDLSFLLAYRHYSICDFSLQDTDTTHIRPISGSKSVRRRFPCLLFRSRSMELLCCQKGYLLRDGSFQYLLLIYWAVFLSPCLPICHIVRYLILDI